MGYDASSQHPLPSRLTSTDAPGHGHVVAVITLQPFVVVAWPHRAAVLVQLGRTHLAAPTSIRHGADSWGADRGLVGAVAHGRAASSHLEEDEGERGERGEIGGKKELHLCGSNNMGALQCRFRTELF